MRRKRVTSIDLAKLARVSSATISRAFTANARISTKKRRGWFSDALAHHGLTFEAEVQGDYSYDSGYKEAVMLLRRQQLDAVICGNDVMAFGVRDAAERLLGLKVPKDLAIVGHDGISMGAWESHSITTVAFNRVAYFDAIVGIIERDDEVRGSNETVMPCHLRWGSST
jgi:DNA-binding LacI/PurR family transcriptional regulator